MLAFERDPTRSALPVYGAPARGRGAGALALPRPPQHASRGVDDDPRPRVRKEECMSRSSDTVAAVDWQTYAAAAEGAFEQAETREDWERAHVEYLGRKSPLKLALREVRDRETGIQLNSVREVVEGAADFHLARIAQVKL